MNNDSQWQYKPDGQTAAQQPELPSSGVSKQPVAKPAQNTTITWTASEYIDHTRGAGWYLSLVAGTVVLSAAVYLLTKDYFAGGVIVFMAVILGIFSTHKPKQIPYELSSSGLKAAERNYPYNLFKSFTVIRENALCSLNFIPIKRFMPTLSVYFDPAEEKKIVELLGGHLPYEEGGLDAIELLSRHLRF